MNCELQPGMAVPGEDPRPLVGIPGLRFLHNEVRDEMPVLRVDIFGELRLLEVLLGKIRLRWLL